MRTRMLIPLLGAAALLVLPSCSKDDSAKSSSTTTTEKAEDKTTTTGDSGSDGENADVATALSEGTLQLGEEESLCLADALVAEYGHDTALQLAQDTQSPIPEDKLDAVSTMFADCVSAESYAASLANTIFEGQDVDEATVTCMSEGLDGKVKDVVVEANGSDTNIPPTIASIIDECVSPETYAEFLTPVVQAMGLQGEDVSCVAEKLAVSVPFSQFMLETQNDEPSDALIAAVSDAAGACGVSTG